jgi:hypothetical protein
MQLRETTLTDLVVLRLQELCYPNVITYTFPAYFESRTGADMVIWFTEGQGRCLGLRIQCKVMNKDFSFNELDERQCDDLIRTARTGKGCLPLYLLYAAWPFCKPPFITFCPCVLDDVCGWDYPLMIGNWWISASRVKTHLPKKHLDKFLEDMRPWHEIVCWPSPRPTPDRILDALRHTVFRNAREAREVEIADELPRYVQLARQGDLPDSVEALRELIGEKPMRSLMVVRLE